MPCPYKNRDWEVAPTRGRGNLAPTFLATARVATTNLNYYIYQFIRDVYDLFVVAFDEFPDIFLFKGYL